MSRIIRLLNACICLASLGLFVFLALSKTPNCLGTPMMQHLIAVLALVLFCVSAMSIPARKYYIFGIFLLPEIAAFIFLALIPASDHYCVITNLNALNTGSSMNSNYYQQPGMQPYQEYGHPGVTQYNPSPTYDPDAGY